MAFSISRYIYTYRLQQYEYKRGVITMQIQKINIRKTSLSDIERLIKLRLDFLTESYGENFTSDEIHKLTEQLQEYYPKHLDAGDFVAALAEIDGEIAATAFMIISEKPANIRSFITGKTAVILNVLTYPEYRRQGIATKLLELLIDEAKKADASYIELSASLMGKSVFKLPHE